ncbi:hypothetical protein ACP275_07G042100 [Erythranthe tilingii]
MTNSSSKGVDLGLESGSKNYSAETRSKSGSTGAGGNAKSRMDIAFAASDPLSELVWSSNKGLGLKCADKKNVGPGVKELSTTQKLTILKSMLEGEDRIDDDDEACSNDKMEEKAGNVDVQIADIADIAECSKRNAACSNYKTEEKAGNVDVQIADIADCSKRNAEDSLAEGTSESKVNTVIRGTSCGHIVGSALPISSKPHADDEVTSAASTDTKKKKNKTSIPISAPPMEIEGSAENDLAQNSRICLPRENGKEKALSDDKDDSHVSMESCNSATLFSKGVKKRFLEQGHQLVESKRMKSQIEGINYGSTSVVKPDSSFMNWISNMVKGLSDSNNKKDSSALALVSRPENDCKSPNVGFQSVFRSMYTSDKKAYEGEKDNSCKQIVLSNKDVNQRTSGGSNVHPINPWIFSLKDEVSPSGSFSKEAKITTENTSPDIPLPEKSNPSGSLWITRLYTRTPGVENSNKVITKEPFFPKAANNLDCEKISEANGDSFDLKPARKSSTFTLICFYCGRSDHYLRKCPELTETEIEGLLVKIGSFDKVEESCCFCIRCFRFDHWAISCPSVAVPPRRRHVACTSKKSSFASDSQNYLKFPRGVFVNSHAVAEGEIFRAIKKLRMSRSDILRSMDSNISSTHLNGFFLRLRLGKLEAGLGWTGYYVARITGYTTEIIDYKSKKSILVDVGGIKSSVGSQYVSNHDFLEDEIKSWWSRISKTGDKIPLLDELNSKFEDRKSLGF